MRAPSIATLVIIRNGNELLLGEKKSGEIGTGMLNAPGGKWEDHETILDCAVRETKEEVGVTLNTKDLRHTGVLKCFASGEYFQLVHVYYTESFCGVPRKTKSMRPKWIEVQWLYSYFRRMHEGDRYWFEKAARGERFRCSIWYKRPGEGYLAHELSDY